MATFEKKDWCKSSNESTLPNRPKQINSESFSAFEQINMDISSTRLLLIEELNKQKISKETRSHFSEQTSPLLYMTVKSYKENIDSLRDSEYHETIKSEKKIDELQGTLLSLYSKRLTVLKNPNECMDDVEKKWLQTQLPKVIELNTLPSSQDVGRNTQVFIPKQTITIGTPTEIMGSIQIFENNINRQIPVKILDDGEKVIFSSEFGTGTLVFAKSSIILSGVTHGGEPIYGRQMMSLPFSLMFPNYPKGNSELYFSY